MRMFSLLTYEDYILNTIVKSSYSKNSLTLLLMCAVTVVLKFHLSAIISALFIFNSVLDLAFPIFVSLFISAVSGSLFRYVETHKTTWESIVDYFLNNYSKKQFVVWKRLFLSVLVCYSMIVLLLVKIDNYFIAISIIQTSISFIITDLIE